MKLNPYSNVHNQALLGLYPFLLITVLFIVHYFFGTLELPDKGDLRSLRDFNTAIGMSLLSGYFWFCLQLNHKNVVSTLISILVKTNQLSHLNEHRRKLAYKFQLHCINCLITAVFITVLYVLIENLFISDVQTYQYVIAVCAVLFWFLFFLFLIQSTTNVIYLRKQVLSQTENYLDYLNSLASLARYSFVNATLSIGAVTLFPIFWFGKSIPMFDLVMALTFSLVVVVYLFSPVLKLHSLWAKEKDQVTTKLHEKRKSRSKRVEKYEQCEQELEYLGSLTMRLFRRRDKIRLIACVSLISISWSIAIFFSFNINS